MMQAQRDAGMMNRGAQGNPGGRGAPIVRDKDGPAQPTLAEVGIDKHLADRARKTAAIPEDDFEETLAEHRPSGLTTWAVFVSWARDVALYVPTGRRRGR